MFYFAPWKIGAIALVCFLGLYFTVTNFVPRSAVPNWVPFRQLNLGLDLKGGSYLLLQVDTAAIIRERLETVVTDVRTRLRDANIGYTSLGARDRSVAIQLRDRGRSDDVANALKDFTQLSGGGLLGQGMREFEFAVSPDGLATLRLTDQAITDKQARAVEQSIEIIRRRIDETGVNEPVIARQGAERVLVQLPGLEDPDRIKRLLGKTAKMTFRLLDSNVAAVGGQPPPGVEFLPSEDTRYGAQTYAVRKKIEVDGASLTDARPTTDSRTGEWVVNFKFDNLGAKRFGAVTQQNVGKPFAIVLDNKVISAPVIREPILGGSGQISGNFTAKSANELAVMLRAGALPAPLTVVEERSVGPELGADSIRAGLYACGVGFVLVVGYMIAAYGLFGFFADIALVINLLLTVACLSLLEATLTLPGIAGILLTLGMSVDANILINERIREETLKGRPPISAMEAGFKRAFATIVDSNLTVLVKMVILFVLGYGAVKGFAVTISLGVITSMFTATVLVRLMMSLWVRRRRPAALAV